MYVLVGYLSVEINNSDTKNHFIELYDEDTTGHTPSNKTFWGEVVVSPTNLVLDGYLRTNINGSQYWLKVYVADPVVACCSNLTGLYNKVE